jgi:hypothetical protein
MAEQSRGDESLVRFETNSTVRPAIEVDCSDWTSEVPVGPALLDRFVTLSSVRPAVEVDCSDWGVALELTLSVAPDCDPGRAYLAVADLILHLSEYERQQGGTGLVRDRERSRAENGVITIVLVPLSPNGAAERMQRLGELIEEKSAGLQVHKRVLQVA